MHAIVGVYALLDHTPEVRHPPAAWVDALVADGGGAQVIQLRAKHAGAEERRALAEQIAPMCLAAGVPLVINDDIELALAPVPGIWGLHVGQEDLAAPGVEPGQLRARLQAAGRGLGISTHDLAQVRAAAETSPDYIAVGPVYATSSKVNPDPVVGLETLAHAARLAAVPVVAIGGITLSRAPACLQAGAAAVAVIGALRAESLAQIRRQVVALRQAIDPGPP